MKTKFGIIIIVLLAALLTACGVETESEESPEVSQYEQLSTESETQTATAQNTATPENNKTFEKTENESESTMTEEGEDTMKLQIGDYTFTAVLADNSSAEALKELLEKGPVTIEMRDYASMEKVGPLGTSLPRNDEQITTEAGDIILYQGDAIVIYYAPNSWNFTRLGKINDITQDELIKALGKGNVSVTFSMD